MADAVEMSPALVSRVISGERPPSRKLVEAIARQPQNNAKWLHTGKGKPIQSRPQILTDIGALVPVAKQPLPGPLLESEDLLSHRFLSLPRAFFSATTYAIEVQSCRCDPALLKNEFLRPGVMLIVESSTERINEVVQAGFQELCVMHLSEYGAALAITDSDFFGTTRDENLTEVMLLENELRRPSKRDRAIELRPADAVNADDDATAGNLQQEVEVIGSTTEEAKPRVVGLITLELRVRREL